MKYAFFLGFVVALTPFYQVHHPLPIVPASYNAHSIVHNLYALAVG